MHAFKKEVLPLAVPPDIKIFISNSIASQSRDAARIDGYHNDEALKRVYLLQLSHEIVPTLPINDLSRTILCEVFFNGRTIESVASDIGAKPGITNYRYHKALGQMKEALEKRIDSHVGMQLLLDNKNRGYSALVVNYNS